jgi:hypothetical protein
MDTASTNFEVSLGEPKKLGLVSGQRRSAAMNRSPSSSIVLTERLTWLEETKMRVRFKRRDVESIKSRNLESKFVEILRALQTGDGTMIRERTTESDVYAVDGDLRLLCRRSPADPREIILAEHSGRGPRGGGYEEVNRGQPNEDMEIDQLISELV